PDVDEYLQQFIVFRLKVADALTRGIDTTRAFRDELKGYRNQLAQNYLTDNQTKEKLLQRTYQRYLTEINAWHILVNCPQGARPEDTLFAYNKASGIRERILRGEAFEHVARSTSDDPSVRLNGGNLGYFTVFQMITPFEDAAYNLRKNAVSEPVRTPYGYHIIKIADIRPSKGKVRVAHIMKAAPPNVGEKEAVEAEEAINKIYRELNEGASFSEMAQIHSDHKETAAKGGIIDWFGAGEIVNEFSEAALSLTDTGNYTKPVRTMYGWHIIKLLDKKAPGSFEETRSFLESRINQSYLNSLSKKTFINKLKKEYNFRINQTAYSWFVDNTDTLIIKGLAKYNRAVPAGNLYSFSNQHLTSREFASYIEKRKSRIITSDPAYFINQSVDLISSDQIIQYENSILEDKYPDFRYLMKEFHDGILLFEISEEKIWNRVQQDSSGLMKYYEEHKHEFLTRRGLHGKIYSLNLPDSEKKLLSAYRRYSRKKETDQLMLRKFNKKIDSLLVITEKQWYEGDDPVLDKIKWTVGPQPLKMNNLSSILVINEILEPVPLPFNEVEGEMMAAYQDYLEKEWIGQLRQKYAVKIDSGIYNQVKKSLVNE
ncbi:MAG: peptidylprolyl isomerase, partial [Bacteroidales bacterium]|nr:peptidylprolyl isomerase [Bacteroidales bacterium]